jgi:thioredoxin reductase
LGLLWDRVQQVAAIKYYDQAQITNVQPSDDGRFMLTSQVKEVRKEFEADYLIPAIGRRPALSFLGPTVKNDLKRLKGEGKLYLIGDVCNDHYRQTAIAVGDGLRAAMNIEERLMGES